MENEITGKLRGVELSAELADEIRKTLAASKASSTIRAYQAAWKNWQNWCDAGGFESLPGTPDALAAYLTERAKSIRSSSLNLACTAIGDAHKRAGFSNPCADPVITTLMRGLRRQAVEKGEIPAQAAALTYDVVDIIRNHIESQTGSRKKALRDLALITLLAATGLRRSEAAVLEWSDIYFESDGTGRLYVRRSKTDQTGKGAVIAIPARVMEDLDRWDGVQGAGRTGRVFGLSGRQISRRIAANAAAAGLGEGFSGHSGRVGMAQTMTRKGAPIALIMRQGRWSSTIMVARYTRRQSAGEALRYL